MMSCNNLTPSLIISFCVQINRRGFDKIPEKWYARTQGFSGWCNPSNRVIATTTGRCWSDLRTKSFLKILYIWHWWHRKFNQKAREKQDINCRYHSAFGGSNLRRQNQMLHSTKKYETLRSPVIMFAITIMVDQTWKRAIVAHLKWKKRMHCRILDLKLHNYSAIGWCIYGQVRIGARAFY